MKVLRISGIEMSLDKNEKQLLERVISLLAVRSGDIINLEVVKKAIDARRNKPPHFVYVVQLSVADGFELSVKLPDGIEWKELEDKQPMPNLSKISASALPVVVVGTGPAGLFAAYILARRGARVLMLERGTSIEKRTRDVQSF
jgi:uncharacterized FAD-dependent dehydrogenase